VCATLEAFFLVCGISRDGQGQLSIIVNNWTNRDRKYKLFFQERQKDGEKIIEFDKTRWS